MVKILNPFQEIALEQIKEIKLQGKSRIILNMPPGIGKNLIAINECLPYKKVLYLAHSNELIKQSYDAFNEDINKDELCLIKDNKDFNKLKRYNFVTIQRLKNHYLELDKNLFDYIIIDEAHHCPADSYRNILDYYDSFYLGLTATPFRLDNQSVLELFYNNLITVGSLVDAINKGYLTPYSYYAFKDNIDYSKISVGKIDYNRKDLDRCLFIDKRDQAVINNYKEHALNKKTIAFCNSINHVKRSEYFFKKEGLNCESIVASTPLSERKKIFNDFKKGVVNLIFTVNIFNEGLDFPDADCVMLLRPTMSFGLILQQIGRALRKTPNKKTALILDFVGNHPYSYRVRQILSNNSFIYDYDLMKPKYVYPINCRVFFDKTIENCMDRQLLSFFIKDMINFVREYFKIKKQLAKRFLFTEDILIYGSKSLRDFLNHVGIFKLWFLMQEKVGIKTIRKQEFITKGVNNKLSNFDKALIPNYFGSMIAFNKEVEKFKKSKILFYQDINVKGNCPRCLNQKAKSCHHIIPRKYGGGDNKENLIWLCVGCHDEVEILTEDWINDMGIIDPKKLRSLIINLGL